MRRFWPAIAGLALLLGCSDVSDPDGAIKACEEATASILSSPSSFTRVWAEYTPRSPLDRDEFVQFSARKECSIAAIAGNACESADFPMVDHYLRLSAAKLQLEKEGISNPSQQQRDEALQSVDEQAHQTYLRKPIEEIRTGFVTLQYDADNAFGANLRSYGICRFGPIGDKKAFEIGDIFAIGPVSNADGDVMKQLSAERKN